MAGIVVDVRGFAGEEAEAVVGGLGQGEGEWQVVGELGGVFGSHCAADCVSGLRRGDWDGWVDAVERWHEVRTASSFLGTSGIEDKDPWDSASQAIASE